MGRATEIRKLDAALSRYVRSSNADDAGYVTCWTCSRVKKWQEVDNGHFQTRAKYSTRWLYKPSEGLVNMMPQCKKCNMANGGQQYLFGQRLDKEFGEGTADEVIKLSNQTKKFATAEIIEMRKHYEKLFEG